MQKTPLALYGLLLLTSFFLFNLTPLPDQQSPIKQTFNSWKLQFNKNYPSQFQQNYRFLIFTQNYHMVNQHNHKYQTGEQTSFLKLNHFSDLTSDEINNAYFPQLKSHSHNNFVCSGKPYPKKDTFDANFTLDSKMISTAVYNQNYEQCKSGYAFATAAAVESLMYKIFNNIIPLSAQLLVDCSKETGNQGCTGGTSLNALNYLINRGAMRQSEYQYDGKTGECKYTAAKKIFELLNCVKVDSNLVMLKSQILNQPVIVSFDASDSKFLQYKGGLYSPPSSCGSKVNHYMLAVGWGQVTTGVSLYKKTNYYIIVKNSMGMSWGENGYGKIVVQVDKDPTNGCGLLTDMYFPYG